MADYENILDRIFSLQQIGSREHYESMREAAAQIPDASVREVPVITVEKVREMSPYLIAFTGALVVESLADGDVAFVATYPVSEAERLYATAKAIEQSRAARSKTD